MTAFSFPCQFDDAMTAKMTCTKVEAPVPNMEPRFDPDSCYEEISSTSVWKARNTNGGLSDAFSVDWPLFGHMVAVLVLVYCCVQGRIRLRRIVLGVCTAVSVPFLMVLAIKACALNNFSLGELFSVRASDVTSGLVWLLAARCALIDTFVLAGMLVGLSSVKLPPRSQLCFQLSMAFVLKTVLLVVAYVFVFGTLFGISKAEGHADLQSPLTVTFGLLPRLMTKLQIPGFWHAVYFTSLFFFELSSCVILTVSLVVALAQSRWGKVLSPKGGETRWKLGLVILVPLVVVLVPFASSSGTRLWYIVHEATNDVAMGFVISYLVRFSTHASRLEPNLRYSTFPALSHPAIRDR